MLFDTHAHYDDDQFDPDREALLASLPERGVGLLLRVAGQRVHGGPPRACTRRSPEAFAPRPERASRHRENEECRSSGMARRLG